MMSCKLKEIQIDASFQWRIKQGIKQKTTHVQFQVYKDFPW